MRETRKEITEEVLERRRSSPVPFHIDVLPPVARALREHLGTQDIDRAMGNYLRWLSPARQWQTVADDLAIDEFGVVWKRNERNRGYVFEHPLKEPELSRYRFPVCDYHLALSEYAGAIKKDGDCFLLSWIGDLFERANFLRGLDNILMDFKLNASFAHALLDSLEEIIHRNIEAMAVFELDGFFLSDDYGLERGLMMSPETWREFLKPRLRRIFEHCHRVGKKTFLHSCGDVEKIIPDLIEVGLDVLHPIQPEAMDVRKIKREFGKELCLYGGISTQGWLLRLKPDELKSRIRALVEQLSVDGGYILAPGITLQDDVPGENLIAFLEVARELGGI